ncbi:uncharacterized protein C2845_PM07G30090 [Panicum miliaceum]|uniref:Uncharacterized protein n=1 Tax=Panicum miliaceum TaxID=4540 RepID=A0A3L6STI9_PANMI|nr:uncharacterized protein C2845_PM07G30090 [Panicum miliaceum]
MMFLRRGLHALAELLMLFVAQVIFNFRLLALLAIAESLAAGRLPASCFLNGCVYIKEAYQVYWSSCIKGVHSGQMVLKVAEAIDEYLAGTVMLIFGMGLYVMLFSNTSTDVPSESYRSCPQGIVAVWDVRFEGNSVFI